MSRGLKCESQLNRLLSNASNDVVTEHSPFHLGQNEMKCSFEATTAPAKMVPSSAAPSAPSPASMSQHRGPWFRDGLLQCAAGLGVKNSETERDKMMILVRRQSASTLHAGASRTAGLSQSLYCILATRGQKGYALRLLQSMKGRMAGGRGRYKAMWNSE